MSMQVEIDFVQSIVHYRSVRTIKFSSEQKQYYFRQNNLIAPFRLGGDYFNGKTGVLVQSVRIMGNPMIFLHLQSIVSDGKYLTMFFVPYDFLCLDNSRVHQK